MSASHADRLSAIRQDLADVPFAELQKLQDNVGSKVYNEVLFGRHRQKAKDELKKQYKRVNRNRPQEVSSKKPVSRFREVIAVKKQTCRDPRFDDLSGQYVEETFEKNYQFLGDIKERERRELVKTLHKTTDSQKQLKIQRLLFKLEQQEQAKHKKQSSKELEKKYMKKEKELVKQGKKPFFLKRSDKKKLELAEKFKALRSSGKVEKYLAKKRKKNAQKDRKKLPSISIADSRM